MNLNINFQSIDKYYVALTVLLILMSLLLIFSFRGIFSTFLIAQEFDPSQIAQDVTVQKTRLDEAYSFAFDKNIIHLQTGSIPIPTPTPKKASK